jgi:heat shock protein HspQ
MPVGRSEAHALSAAWTVGFEVSLTLGSVVPLAGVVVDVDPLLGAATPWSVRQLR